jgi:Smg protein
MMFLEQAKVLNPSQRELVIDRAMALPQSEISLEEIRWIVLMALWNQNKASDYLFVEDAMFNESRPTLH